MAEQQRFYDAGYWGDTDLLNKFQIQREDARYYFSRWIRPRLDRAYKLYISYNGDRARFIKEWQANVAVPYVHGVVETLMPRILDARPEFSALARKEKDQEKSIKLQQTMDYTWEVSEMDKVNEDVTRSSLVYGSGFFQTSWKKDVRKQKFLTTKDLANKTKGGVPNLKFEEKEVTFYDAPYTEWVDNYSLWYDWHNIPRESKQFWFKRLVLTGAEIKRRYPLADPERLRLALLGRGQDLNDYASVRRMVKFTQWDVVKGADYGAGSGFIGNYLTETFANTDDNNLRMHEVFEWWRPFDDCYAVMVNWIPILVDGSMPIPYDFKEAPFIDVPFLKLPGEFEGMGLPLILENPQLMLNMIKNQRLDAVTLNIHKMWIVNPLANIDKKELVTRPFGIIYSTDPNGVREVQFSDVKMSAYQEEDRLKSDMRYAAGVDDSSMGVGGSAGSATEVRHLRESTLERVRLFVNHLGDAYSKMMRQWLSMYRQFLSEPLEIRIVGEDGNVSYPLVEKDDLKGEFDYKAAVLPSIAGKADLDKKQAMDLFQLLVNMPFVDPQKLTRKVLRNWNWSLDSVAKGQEEQMPPGMPGMPGMPGQEGAQPGAEQGAAPPGEPPNPLLMRGGGPPISALPAPPGFDAASAFGQASSPINLLQSGGLPPTVGGPGAKTTNPRGMNRKPGGGTNTNIPLTGSYEPMKNLHNQATNLQQ